MLNLVYRAGELWHGAFRCVVTCLNHVSFVTRSMADIQTCAYIKRIHRPVMATTLNSNGERNSCYLGDRIVRMISPARRAPNWDRYKITYNIKYALYRNGVCLCELAAGSFGGIVHPVRGFRPIASVPSVAITACMLKIVNGNIYSNRNALAEPARISVCNSKLMRCRVVRAWSSSFQHQLRWPSPFRNLLHKVSTWPAFPW